MESCTLSLERTAGARPSLMLPAGGRGASHLTPYLGRAADEVSFVAPARETWTENRQGIFFFLRLFIYLAARSLRCFAQLSLIVASRAYSLVVVLGLLIVVIVVASLVAEHGFKGTRASVVVALRLWSTDAVVVAHRLSCFSECGIFLDHGWNPRLMHR